MFPVGMAALDQGYYGAAPSYWKARELEDTQQAYNILGQTFQQMAGIGQQPTGWGGQQVIPGQMPAPPQPPPGMPPGAPGMMPPGMPRPGMPPQMPPTQPQGMLGSIIPNPAAGAAAIPSPGGMPPVQAPGPTAPGMPPNGAGLGQPPGGLGGPQQPQQPPPQIQQSLGPAPYDWRSVAQTIAQANPGAPPAVIARAVTMMMPFLNQDSQMYMRQLNAQLAEERLRNTERHQYETESQGRERLGIQESGQELRRERYQTLSEQATRRLDQGDQRLIETKRANMERERQRAESLAASSDAKAAAEARQRWQAATNDYHRTMREKIGAAGITDNKQRKQMMEDLNARQKADQDDIDNFYQQMKERQGKAPYKPPAESPGNVRPQPSEGQMQGAKEQMRQGLQAPETRQQFDQQNRDMPAGKPQAKAIPKASLDRIKEDLAKMGPEQKQNYLRSLQQQGYDTSGL